MPLVSSTLLGSHPAPPPDSHCQTLTFEGQLDPRGGEAVVLGVGGPPAQSQQGGPEEDADHGHGGHAPGFRGRGDSGEGGVGGASLPKRAQGGGMSVCCTRHPPGGGTSPTSPHPTLHHPLARSILRGGLGASPGRRGGPSAKPCSAGWEGGGQESGGAQPHLLGCQAKQTGRGEHGGEHRCSTLLHPSRRALPR